MSLEFNKDTGERESSQSLWEGSTWERLGRSRGRTLDRANSIIGYRSRAVSEAIPVLDKVIGIVDPFSTGAHLAAEAHKLGYKIIKILSCWDSPVSSLVQQGLVLDFFATVQHDDRKIDQEEAIQEVIIYF